MGNHHSANQMDYHQHHFDNDKRGFVARRRQKLEELKNRRQSMPHGFFMDTNVSFLILLSFFALFEKKTVKPNV